MKIQLTKDDIENVAYERMANQHRPLFLVQKWSLNCLIMVLTLIGMFELMQNLPPYNEWLLGFVLVPSESIAVVITCCLMVVLSVGLFALRRLKKHVKAWVKDYNQQD